MLCKHEIPRSDSTSAHSDQDFHCLSMYSAVTSVCLVCAMILWRSGLEILTEVSAHRTIVAGYYCHTFSFRFLFLVSPCRVPTKQVTTTEMHTPDIVSHYENTPIQIY